MNIVKYSQEINLLKQICFFVLLLGLIVIWINSYIFNVIIVHQDSMNPTLFEGDLLYTNKFTYLFIEPKRKDVIIMLKEESEGIGKTRVGKTLQDYINNIMGKDYRIRYIKRIVAVEGDEVDMRDGNLYINNILQVEEYTMGKTYPLNDIYPITIDKGYVYVLGDNRECSLDSRAFGPVELSKIESKVELKTVDKK